MGRLRSLLSALRDDNNGVPDSPITSLIREAREANESSLAALARNYSTPAPPPRLLPSPRTETPIMYDAIEPPPPIQLQVSDGAMSITGVRWSSGERVPTIDAGSALGLNIRYTVRDEPCPGCIKQIEVGFEGEVMFATCIYDANPPMSGAMGMASRTASFGVAAPPGVYYLVANYAEQFSCGGSSMEWYGGAPGPAQRIAAICVRAP